MITIAPVPTDMPKYERNDWKHWEDHDGDCQDARQEVLIAESLVPVTYKTDRECRVETGWWYGAFTGTHIEDPGNLDIDHLVPLKNAHNSGGWPWTADRREEYANYLGDDDHPIAVLDRANQSKGARGPEEWRPPDGDLLVPVRDRLGGDKAAVATHYDEAGVGGRGGDASEVREPAGGGGLGSPGECDGGT